MRLRPFSTQSPRRCANERGEVASWLILAAGLAAAGLLAANVLASLTSDLADDVVASATSASSGPGSDAGSGTGSDAGSGTGSGSGSGTGSDAGSGSGTGSDPGTGSDAGSGTGSDPGTGSDAGSSDGETVSGPGGGDDTGSDDDAAVGPGEGDDGDEGDADDEADPTRASLDDVLADNQVKDDEMVEWRPQLGGLPIDAFWMDTTTLTKTEAELLDRLASQSGVLGLNTFRGLRDEAFDVSEQYYAPTPSPQDPGGVNNNHTDAFRHAYWSARMAQEFGPEFATAFTEAHEGVPGNEPSREAMDLYNNNVGIQIAVANPGASPEELAGLIDQAVQDGDLVVIDQNGDLGWSDDIAIGSTGHPDPADPPLPGDDPAEWDTGS